MENKETVFTPKKDYYEPMHTAEHILNQTMIRMFNCGRSPNAHIEKNKSKCDYPFSSSPTQEQIAKVEEKVNEVIRQNLPVIVKEISREEAAKISDLSKLPESAGDTLRVVLVGDYDTCPCIGKHVFNTSEIGQFKLFSWNWENGRLRIRYKLEAN